MPRFNRNVDPQTIEKLCAELEKTALAEKASMLREQGNCPLVEDIKDDPKHKLVTFFYYDDTGKCEDVKVTSLGFCSRDMMNISKKIVYPPQKDPTILGKSEIPYIPLERLTLAKNIFVATVVLPAEACISYTVDVPLRQELDDPLNCRSFQGGQFPRSVLDLSLPKNDRTETPALNPKRLKRYSVDAEGNINERDGNYPPGKNERMFSAYLPEKFFKEADKTKTYPMRLFLDGKWYLNERTSAISPKADTIDLMLEPLERVDSGENNDYDNRDFEYLPANHPKLATAGFEAAGIKVFTDFLSEKFIPFARKKFNISKDPNDLTVCGSSLSGFAAVYIGVNCQETSTGQKIFGNVLTQSAALWIDAKHNDGRLLKQLSSNESLQESHFYLEASTIESEEVFKSNKKFAGVMTEQNIPHCFIETCGEHGSVSWSKSMPGAVSVLQDLRSEKTSGLVCR